MGQRRPGLQRAGFRRVGAPPATSGGTVTSVGSADGSILVTNPTTTPDLSVVKAIILADSVNTTGTALSGIASGKYSVPALAWVVTVGAFFELQQSALSVDNLTVVTASGKAGYQWLRVNLQNRFWTSKNTYFIDGANSTGTASDENLGTTSGAALKTFGELARRLFSPETTLTLTVNVLSDSTDAANFSAIYNMTIVGTPTVIYTGTITSWTAQALGPAADDNQLVDSGIPVSYTASGLLAAGVIFQDAARGAAWWGAKDLGSKTLRSTVPCDSTANTLLTPVAGDTYTASTLPKIGTLGFNGSVSSTSTPRITLRLLNLSASSPPFTILDRCAITFGTLTSASRLYRNCGFFTVQNFMGPLSDAPAVIVYGLMLGPAGNSINSTTVGDIQIGGVTFQSCAWSTGQQANTLQNGRCSFHDTTSRFHLARLYGNVSFILASDASYGCGGKGNTGSIFEMRGPAQFTYDVSQGVPAVAGSTSLANCLKFSNGLMNLPLTALPVRLNSSQQAIAATDESAPAPFLTAAPLANGVVATAFTGLGPAGVSTTIQRWAQIPDGLGGFFTVASFT